MQATRLQPFAGGFNSSRTGARNPLLAMALAIALALPGSVHAQALTPAFTYQGELRSAGTPANASFDMEFRLYSTLSGSGQIGPVVTRLAVPVANGLFSVPLDFGAAQFAGDRQWLEIAIRPAGGGAYETLSPRTEVTAAPYAWSAAVALANSVSTTSLVDGAVQSADIAAGAVGTTQINPAQVQRRVSGTCAGTQGVQSVNADGTVVCGSFAGGAGTVTSIATGAGLSGGPITASGTISVAPGGIGGALVNPAQVQLRVSGSCAGVGRMTAISETGGVFCVPDLDTGVDTVNVSGGLTRTLAGRTLNLGTDSTIQRRTAGSSLSCPAGQVLQAVAADGTPSCVSAWLASGNAGTNPSANFIGTTDAQPLLIRADSQRVASLEAIALTGPAGGHTANVLLGSRHNEITPGVRGATIAGGGVQSGDSEPDFTLNAEAPNQVTDHYGTVGGGFANRAGDAAGTPVDHAFATVGGGQANTAGRAGIVGGGSFNAASGDWSTIGGGFTNTASGDLSTVAGGSFNIASGVSSTVGGGAGNCAGGSFSWAGGLSAKVRPATAPASGNCAGLPSYPGGTGDAGTYVWADSQGSDFVSTGNNQFLVRASGGVGFNTNSPVTDFDIVGNRNGHAALIRNTDSTSPDGLAIRLAVATPTTANNFLSFQRSSGANSGSVEGNGSGGVVFNTSGGDYAEYLPLADGVAKSALPPGRVVGIRGGRVSLDTDGAEQLGVVSTNPAISGNDPGAAQRGSHALIAFLGQVDIVVAGPVNAGDFLIASGHADGRAIAVPPDQLSPELLGEVVGRAWTASTGAEASVRALVGLNPADAAQSHALAQQNVEIEAQRHALAQQNVEIEAQRVALARLTAENSQVNAALARVSAENAAMHSELSALRTQSVARDAAIAELQRRLDQMARERGRP